MSIGGEHSNVSGGQVGGQVPVSGASTDPNAPSFSNPILEATLLNQLVNVTQPAADMPSTTTLEGSVEEQSNSESQPLAPVGEKQEQSQGRGSSGGQGDGERTNDQNAGYNSSVLAESTAVASALVMAVDLQQSFTEADYSKTVAETSISNAQEASTGALDEASTAAFKTEQFSIDQANAQITQAAGSIGGSAASMGAMGMGFMSQDNWTASKTLDSYSTTNKAFTAYKETPPPAPRSPDISSNPDVPTENGVVRLYDPSTSSTKLNSQREFSQNELGNPSTGEPGPVYTQKEYNDYTNNSADFINKTKANPNAKDVNGFTAQQKLSAIQSDEASHSSKYQFPEGTYSTAQRQTVLSGKPLDATSSDDTTTKTILQDAKTGGYEVKVVNTKTRGGENLQKQINSVNKDGFIPPDRIGTRPRIPTDEEITRDRNGIAEQVNYDPTDDTSPPLSSREIDIKPNISDPSNPKITYTTSDRIAYEKWNNTTISKRVSDAPIVDESSNDGPTAEQKMEAIKKDIANGTTENQRPEGWYTASDRATVAGGGRLSSQEDPTGEKTRAIVQDLKLGGFKLQDDAPKTAVPDPTNGAASLNYNENGIATTANNPGANLGQGQAKVSRFNEFSSDEIGANPDGSLKENGGPVYTNQDREQYLKAQASGKPDGIQDDEINGITATAKRNAIKADLSIDKDNTDHMFRKGTYTTQDRQEFYATGKLSNDPDGSKRTAILKDLHASGSSDAIQHIKSTSEAGLQNSIKQKVEITQKYTTIAQALQLAMTGFTGIGGAEFLIQAANAKQTADLASAAAQQLSSVQSMNINQGMAIASAAIQAAAAATGNISQAGQINVQLR